MDWYLQGGRKPILTLREQEVTVRVGGQAVRTGVVKFGALIGDHSRLGANAVLSPGTILPPHSVVARLELVHQGAG